MPQSACLGSWVIAAPPPTLIGDPVVLEAQAAGVGAVMVWGLHRDTVELAQIALPVFSYGRCPASPVRLVKQEP